ncbi:MAG: N-acetyltransferase [Helicobacteraceae bacterium]|nr:N-acetyltransferase [Helicobacteraceae bacterium]
MSLTYTKATLNDIEQMQSMVADAIEEGIILPRSNSEVATNIRSYTLCFDHNKIVGYVALHIHNEKLAEVRSLVVNEEYRGKEIGSKLVNMLSHEAEILGIKEMLSLTYKQNFFERLGFKEIPKELIPDNKIWADCIKCKLFPQCNEISLIKTL